MTVDEEVRGTVLLGVPARRVSMLLPLPIDPLEGRSDRIPVVSHSTHFTHERSTRPRTGVGDLTQGFSNMLQVIAPRMPRGFSWVWPAIAVIAIAASESTTVAQAPAAP